MSPSGVGKERLLAAETAHPFSQQGLLIPPTAFEKLLHAGQRERVKRQLRTTGGYSRLRQFQASVISSFPVCLQLRSLLTAHLLCPPHFLLESSSTSLFPSAHTQLNERWQRLWPLATCMAWAADPWPWQLLLQAWQEQLLPTLCGVRAAPHLGRVWPQCVCGGGWPQQGWQPLALQHCIFLLLLLLASARQSSGRVTTVLKTITIN